MKLARVCWLYCCFCDFALVISYVVLFEVFHDKGKKKHFWRKMLVLCRQLPFVWSFYAFFPPYFLSFCSFLFSQVLFGRGLVEVLRIIEYADDDKLGNMRIGDISLLQKILVASKNQKNWVERGPWYNFLRKFRNFDFSFIYAASKWCRGS